MEKEITKIQNNVKKLFLIFLIILLLLISMNIYLFLNKPIKQIIVPVSVIFGDNIGLVGGNESLDFGILPLEISSTRKVFIENEYDFSLNVSVFVEGNIRDFLYGEKYFILKPKEKKEYDVNILSYNDTTKKSYFGNIIFTFYKYNFDD